MKPKFGIDFGKQAPPSLEAIPALASISAEGCNHLRNGLRPPLGIYNVSVGRVCDKVVRLCHRLEGYFRPEGTLATNPARDDLMQEVLDYLELTLYAAAEHVDDIDSIAAGFFPSVALRDRNPDFRSLNKSIKAHKRFIASAANFIKHQQARLRLFSMEFSHAGRNGTLHGYFIEGVSDGVVCPNPAFHKQQEVFSITALAWEVITFLLLCSRDLSIFVRHVGRPLIGPVQMEAYPLARAAIAAARLPLYTFGEEHPFIRCTLVMYTSGEQIAPIESDIYGSLSNKWSLSAEASFGRFTSRFAGDGVTQTFRFAHPKKVELQHWQ